MFYYTVTFCNETFHLMLSQRKGTNTATLNIVLQLFFEWLLSEVILFEAFG